MEKECRGTSPAFFLVLCKYNTNSKSSTMKNPVLIILCFVTLSLCSCDPKALENIMNGLPQASTQPLSNEEVISGLKEALKVGAQNAVSTTSRTNGFLNDPVIRIPFPAEAAKVKTAAISLGMQAQVQQFEATLNHAAEKAAAEAIPVFVNAITSMSIQDGFNILKGDSTAATTYLKNTTSADLTMKFSPIVQKAIDEVKLTSYWEPLANAYNTSTLITGAQQINPDLKAYVTQKALDGLFLYVALEEKKIRRDPAARVSEILRRVFGSIDHN
jgi:hypothetical protein